jgi:hypothetical protein
MYVPGIGWLTERETEWWLSEGDEQLTDFNRGQSYTSDCEDGQGDRFDWDPRFKDSARYVSFDAGFLQQGWRPQGREVGPFPMLDEPDSPTPRFVHLEDNCLPRSNADAGDSWWLSDEFGPTFGPKHDKETCPICVAARGG